MNRRNKKNKYAELITVVCAMLLAVVSPVFVYADYQDNETTSGNSFSASSLNAEVSSTQSGLEVALTAAGMVPGDSVSRDANIDNVGGENFKYKVEFEKVSGSDALCDALQLEAKQGGATVYNDDLLDFTVSGGTLNSGNDDDWDFTVTLPTGSPNSLEGLSCNFKFVFTAWQTDFANPTAGWVDEEELDGNNITTGDWDPVITGVANTNPLDTKGQTNDEMAKVSVSWSTSENTTSNVVYDTVTRADCTGYANHNTPVDAVADNTNHEVTLKNLLAGTTYHYRAVSRDVGGNQVCSSEYSFTIPASTTDIPSSDIVLNEFVPHPSGSESGEWVELYNKSGSDVGVNGWYIYDSTDSGGVMISSANTDTGGTTVSAGGYLVVYLNKSYLNNSGGDTVKLYSGLFGVGTLIDSHSYTGTIPEGKSFARFPDGVGVWIDPDVTPGEKNELKPEEKEAFLTQTANACFDGKMRKESKENICQGEFLKYLGMVNKKKDIEMTDAMWEKMKTVSPAVETMKEKEATDVKTEPASTREDATSTRGGKTTPAGGKADIKKEEVAAPLEEKDKKVEDAPAVEVAPAPKEEIKPEEKTIPEEKKVEVKEVPKEDPKVEEKPKEEPKIEEKPKEEAPKVDAVVSEVFDYFKINYINLC
ncbi:MAG: lamin tail domain-containing protein [Parcubacteria group bacterium]|jgi:hypothetical protein